MRESGRRLRIDFDGAGEVVDRAVKVANYFVSQSRSGVVGGDRFGVGIDRARIVGERLVDILQPAVDVAALEVGF